MALQTVGIREFRAQLHKYTKENKEPLAITSHGEPIGFFIPVGRSPDEKDFAALLEATQKMSSILEEKGIEVDDLLAEFQEARRDAGE